MLKQSSSRIKTVLTILLAVLFVLSLTAVAASAQGNAGHGGGYGPGGIYDTPYYEGNPNEDYAAVIQPDYAGDVFE
jgi:hypothetical protein